MFCEKEYCAKNNQSGPSRQKVRTVKKWIEDVEEVYLSEYYDVEYLYQFIKQNELLQ